MRLRRGFGRPGRRSCWRRRRGCRAAGGGPLRGGPPDRGEGGVLGGVAHDAAGLAALGGAPERESAATGAGATKKMLEATSARRNPEVSAPGRATCRASRSLVREVAMAENAANPRAAPS